MRGVSRFLLNRASHSQLLVVEELDELLHQAVAGQALVDHTGEVALALLQLVPRSLKEGVTQPIDSCWSRERDTHTQEGWKAHCESDAGYTSINVIQLRESI